MLDHLRISARLTSELGRLGRASLRRDRGGVPRSLDDVDAAWLQEALTTDAREVQVAGISVLGGTSGTTDRRRLAMNYSGDEAAHGAPASLFVKIPPRGLAERLFGNLFCLGPTEVNFYRDVRASLPVRVPECFAARQNAAGEFVLLLEDLEAQGAEFPTLVDPLPIEAVKAVVETLASLHATHWGPDIARRLPWLRTPARSGNDAVERFVCERAHAPTMKSFPDLLPETVRRGARQIHVERRALERYWASGPLTLNHGDPHVGNMYFMGGRPGLLDWQVTQHHQGVRDLAYFLILSVDTELRREHEGELFRVYLEQLRERGVARGETDADRLWRLYRSFSLYAYLGTSVTSTMSSLQSEAIATKGLERAAAAVDDLGALELLAELA